MRQSKCLSCNSDWNSTRISFWISSSTGRKVYGIQRLKSGCFSVERLSGEIAKTSRMWRSIFRNNSSSSASSNSTARFLRPWRFARLSCVFLLFRGKCQTTWETCCRLRSDRDIIVERILTLCHATLRACKKEAREVSAVFRPFSFAAVTSDRDQMERDDPVSLTERRKRRSNVQFSFRATRHDMTHYTIKLTRSWSAGFPTRTCSMLTALETSDTRMHLSLVLYVVSVFEYAHQK